MRAFPRSIGLIAFLILGTGCLILILTSCEYKQEGQQGLFQQPGVPARFVSGTRREADVQALIGEPGDKISGILVAGNRFYQRSEEVREPGIPLTQWRYWASRKLSVGPWPFARRQTDSAYLNLAFDGAGILRHIDHKDYHGAWEREGVINKLF